MKIKKIIAWLFGILAVLVIAAAVGGWLMFGTFVKAASSIERLEEGLYVMECNGEYGLDNLLEQGGVSSDAALADFLGVGDGYVPDASMGERMQSLAAIYVPLDGVNNPPLRTKGS